jgi:regulator of sigma E protease
MNLLTAFILLTFLALIGMPQLVNNQYVVKSDATYIQRAHMYTAAATVEANSPAAGAGIKTGDEILAIGKAPHLTTLNNVNVLSTLTSKFAGQTVEVMYKHGDSGPVLGRTITLRTVAEVQNARKEGEQIGYLGVSVYQAQNGLSLVKSTWSAPIVAAGDTKQFTVLTFEGLGRVIAGLSSTVAGSLTGNTQARQAGQTKASSQIVGPVGVFYILKSGAVLGYRFVLIIVAVISLSLAIVNILPLPALDGGHLWLMLFSRLVRRPISPDKEEIIHATGFVVLILLVVLITLIDVKRFF